jgi:mono/diheme cytochrome c family protein
MKSILGVSALMLLIASAYAAELPGASADGKRLHDANCMGCHEERLVQSLDALKKRWATVVISQKSENAVKLS